MEMKKLKRDQSQIQQKQFFERLKGKPFWIWDHSQHAKKYEEADRACCLNHILGLPRKDGMHKPLFNYEKTVIDALEQSKRVWVKKASGLGITELILRYMVWLCTRDNRLQNSQMVIFTGPRVDLAVSLIRRIKELFEGQQIKFDGKETVVELNRVRIEAFPSYHAATARGLPNVSFVFIDEGDFFPIGQQEEVRAVAERYIAKSKARIAMISTPNQPGGLFEKIEREPEADCLYKRLFLDYTVGIGKIYTREEIDNARQSPSFPREYELQYLGRVGNVFHNRDIEEAIRKGWEYRPTALFPNAPKSLGIDPGFGSSSFAFVLTQLKNQRIEVVYASEFDRPNLAEMVQEALNFVEKYEIRNIYIDAANPEFIRALKTDLRERPDYETHITELKRHHVSSIESWMKVIPVPFNRDHKEMLGHAKMLMEKGLIAINETHFPDLIISLRSAKEENGALVKSETAYDDLFDAFRLSLRYYKLAPPGQQSRHGHTVSKGYRSGIRSFRSRRSESESDSIYYYNRNEHSHSFSSGVDGGFNQYRY